MVFTKQQNTLYYLHSL